LITKNRIVSKFAYRSFMQFALILCPFVFFFDAAIHFRGKLNLSLPVMSILLILLNGGLVFTSVMAIYSYFVYRKRNRKGLTAADPEISKGWKDYLPVTLVAAVFSVFAGFQFDTIPRYDGGQYYDAMITATQTFTFSLRSLVSSFMLLTHPMQGTSLLLGTGEMLFPKQSVGVYGVILLLSIIAFFCLYRIMGRIFKDIEPWMKAAGTAVFAFCPYVLGLFSHINPDYITMLLFIFLIYTFSEELDYLAAFMSVLLIFSRETGILFAGSFLIPAMLVRIGNMNGLRFFDKTKKYLLPKRLLLYLIGPSLFACYIVFSKGLTFGESFTQKSSFRWDNNGLFCFGINIGYITTRMEQFLYFNFYWVITLLMFSAILIYFYRFHKNRGVDIPNSASDFSIVIGILLSTMVFLIFSCLYMTISCPRYAVSFALPMSIGCVGAICYIWKRKIVRALVMGVIITLFLLQNYFNLDPSLTFGNQKINAGYQYIYSPTGEYSFMDTSFMGEMYVYNRTFDYSEDLLSQMLKKINPDRNDHFVFISMNWYEIYMDGDLEQTKNFIYWNPEQQKRTYDNDAEGSILLKMVSVNESYLLPDKSKNLENDFYLILTAREPAAVYCSDLIASGYTITESYKVENYIGYFMVYHFVRPA